MPDVKNALTGMLSCAEILRTPELSTEERTAFFSLISCEVDRVISLSQQMVNAADGQERLYLQSYPVSGFLYTLVPVIKHVLATRKITLRLNLDDMGQFLIDAEKMTCAILNLVYNACDAMPVGGTLTITSHCTVEMVGLAFTDTGCGMSPELQTRLFTTQATDGKPHGTGLGLAIVKEIMDVHQGQIIIESDIGKGTTIRLQLPRL